MAQGVAARFWSFVGTDLNPVECWEWGGAFFGKNRRDDCYGAFWRDGRTIGAHVASYVLAYGPVPKGLVVRHRCDNTKCVNPHHLILGTYQENSDDIGERFRRYEGADHHNAHMTADDVRTLVQLHHGGASYSQLAARYGVSKQAVSLILSGKNWKSVTGGKDQRRTKIHSTDGVPSPPT